MTHPQQMLNSLTPVAELNKERERERESERERERGREGGRERDILIIDIIWVAML